MGRIWSRSDEVPQLGDTESKTLRCSAIASSASGPLGPAIALCLYGTDLKLGLEAKTWNLDGLLHEPLQLGYVVRGEDERDRGTSPRGGN